MSTQQHLGFYWNDIRERLKVKQGNKISIKIVSDSGSILGNVTATVLKVYPRFVLLDFGKYRESRLIVDIVLDTRGIYKCL